MRSDAHCASGEPSTVRDRFKGLKGNTNSFPVITRRRFLQSIFVAAAGTTSTFAYVRAIEPKWLDIERVTLPIRGLPASADGRTLAHISDIHLSEYYSAQELFEVVRIINQLQPNWLLLTGDYVGSNAMDAEGLVEPLRALERPAYAVLGNHDLWTIAQVVERNLSEAGVTVLRNAGILLQENLWLAGLDDVWSGRPDLGAALRDSSASATNLLMVHEPDFLDHVRQSGAPVAMQFSGHSHGGQVRLPRLRRQRNGTFSFAPVLPKYGEKYAIGLNEVGSYRVYTNRGLGMWPVPYRFNCRPEITLYTLLSA